MNQLASKLRGYWNYYGVIGNQDSQWEFYRHVQRLLHKWLNRRSQHASYTWTGLMALFKHYGIPRPRITEVVKTKQPSGCL